MKRQKERKSLWPTNSTTNFRIGSAIFPPKSGFAIR